MKIIFLFFMISTANSSVIPDRIIMPFLDILKGREVTSGVKVPTLEFTRWGQILKGGKASLLELEQHEKFLSWAKAVFQMVPKRNPYFGTAFHIGQNLVLTNSHVLSPSLKNLTHCNDFQLLLHDGDTTMCKEVLYCNSEYDFCLIEMSPGLKHALKLRASFRPTSVEEGNYVHTAIGNTKGFGIHLSQGSGIKMGPVKIYFYAPIAEGNSGGPLLDGGGFVFGIVKRQSKSLIGNNTDETYNIAVSMEIVIKLIRDALMNRNEKLEAFNQSVVE